LSQANVSYRPDIDGLRAVSVLAVLAFHAFPGLLPGGFIGVDVFFVISGFLISSIIFDRLEAGSFSFLDFYKRRVLRIFPPLVLLLAFCLVFGWFILLPGEYAKLGKHAAYGAAFVLNILLNGEAGYFDAASETKPLLHLWSLCIEEQFYVIWPMLLFATWRFRRYLLPVLLAALIVSFMLNLDASFDRRSSAFFLAQNRFWELLIGGTLAFARTASVRAQAGPGLRAYRTPRLVDAASVAGLGLLLAGFFVIHRTDVFPGFWALMPALGAFLVIWAGTGGWANRTLLASRPMVEIGLFSYPLYLWHWSLLSFNSTLQYGQPSLLSRVAILAASFLIAWASNRYIERRIRFRAPKLVAPWAVPAALCTVLVTIGLLGARIESSDGYAARFAIAAPQATLTQPISPPRLSPVADEAPTVSPGPALAIADAKTGPVAVDRAVRPVKTVVPQARAAPAAMESLTKPPLPAGPPPVGRTFIMSPGNHDHYRIDDIKHLERCSLTPEQGPESFNPDCVERTPADAPLILLWGDSNAQTLAPGLWNLQKRRPFRLAQFTASGCPPVLGFASAQRPKCAAVNEAVFAMLPQMQPDVILLASQWLRSDADGLELLRTSIERIRAAAPKRIVLIGGSPVYSAALPAYVARKYASMRDEDVPRRDKLQMAFDPTADKIFAKFAAEQGIEYISIVDTLCNGEGCIIRVPFDETHDDIAQFDIHHLTFAGSRFVIDAIADKLFPRAPRNTAENRDHRTGSDD
jgi:peptidoglycan/LPS O-acetylase OafA/YrhL